jgi:hypothetical protein
MIGKFWERTESAPAISRRAVVGMTGAAIATSRLGGSAVLAELRASPEATTYDIEGRLLEVCTCNVLCPCWVGHDPDGGTCDSVFGWAVDKGTVEGLDVSNLVIAMSVHIPGNVFDGNWRAVIYVDDRSSDAQQAALLKVFSGELGGPIANIAALFSEIIAVERVPIDFSVVEGEGTMVVGDYAELSLAPFKGLTGNPTVLQESAFSTIPGSPAFVGESKYFRRTEESHGMSNIDLQGHNAIQGSFRFFG